MREVKFLAVSTALVLASAAKADVVVETTLRLVDLQLTITPSTGVFIPISPFTASANASAQDDFSPSSSQFNQVNDGATSASASTAFAGASGAASSIAFTASAASGVNIPEVTAFASSTGQGGLGVDFGGTGTFEIVSASNTTTSVMFSSQLSGNQSLTTTVGGQFATSEIIYNLFLPDLGATGTTVSFLDNPLSIGPDSTLVSPYAATLTGSVDLQRVRLFCV